MAKILDAEVFIKQLDTIIREFEELLYGHYSDLSDVHIHQCSSVLMRAIAAIHRITGIRSSYSLEVSNNSNKYIRDELRIVIGILIALKADLQAGYLSSVIEIIHSETFADFLEMADHLNQKGYKDAAAVMAGSTLESHLKNLAVKFSIEVVDTNGKPVKAEKLNQELARDSMAYGLLDQKSVTSWLDLRNKAAHGHYSEYTKEQVSLLIMNIQDFIRRTPA